MLYAQMKEMCRTGDVVLHAGNTLGAKILRVLTASQFSHVGLLYHGDENTLWIAEMKPDSGYTLSPASMRIKQMLKTGTVRYGNAPATVSPVMAMTALNKFRDGSLDRRTDPDYSWPAAVVVWLAQWAANLIPKKWAWLYSIAEKYAETNYVCSTLVQHVWAESGEKFSKLADPEDIARKIVTLHKVEM